MTGHVLFTQPDSKAQSADLFSSLKEEVIKQCRSQHVGIADAVNKLVRFSYFKINSTSLPCKLIGSGHRACFLV